MPIRRRIRLPKRRASTVLVPADQKLEALRCHPRHGLAGFLRFCQHVRVWDPDDLEVRPFSLWSGQQRMAKGLAAGDWLFCPKGRQLGITTVIQIYVVWCTAMLERFRVVIVFQGVEYAEEFIAAMIETRKRLPRWAVPRLLIDNRRYIKLANGSSVRVLAKGKSAGRSLSGDLCVIDEASYIPGLIATIAATTPGLERRRAQKRRGQLLILGTTEGPEGDYWRLWRQTYGRHGELLVDGVGPNGFRPLFISCMERTGRDEEWYEAERRKWAAIDPQHFKRQHPRTVEEAFEAATGRVFPKFSANTHVGDIEIPEFALRCRAIDWGETRSAYCVLWIAYIPGPMGLLISPSCPNTIDNFLAYRFDENGRIRKEDDHACDAVRYAVVRHAMHGLVYVYREIYRTDEVAQGWNLLTEIDEIHRLSGWERAKPWETGRTYVPGPDAERYELTTVADRAMQRAIATLSAMDIPCVPSPTIRGTKSPDGIRKDAPRDEVVEGVRHVAMLIDGTQDLANFAEILRGSPAAEAMREVQQGRAGGLSPERRLLAERAARLLRRRPK